MNVQVIEKDGKPEWAVIPYEKYINLIQDSEMLQDIRDYDFHKSVIEKGEELVPGEITFAIMDGANPVNVWRKHRKLTLSQLAEASGITISKLDKIETGKYIPAADELKSIAETLNLDPDDVID